MKTKIIKTRCFVETISKFLHANSWNVFSRFSLTYRRQCTLARSGSNGKEIEEKYLSFDFTFACFSTTTPSVAPLPIPRRILHVDCRTTSVKLVLIDVSLGPRLLLTPRGRNGIDHEMFSPRLARRTWNNGNEVDLRFRLNRNFGV